LNSTKSLKEKKEYLYFTGEETKFREVKKLPKVAQ
jgi:hypothetical protein